MFKMVETNIYPDLSATQLNDQQFRLNRINEIKNYFVAEIKERELKSKVNILFLLIILTSH